MDSLFASGTDSLTLVWGTIDPQTGATLEDTIVWGTMNGQTIVWGTTSGQTIVWGTTNGQTIVWGTTGCDDPSCEPVIWNQ